jgi:hypothetical protein
MLSKKKINQHDIKSRGIIMRLHLADLTKKNWPIIPLSKNFPFSTVNVINPDGKKNSYLGT